MPFRRTADSLIRHIYQWLAGDDEEDHLAAIVCNAMFLMHFEEAIAHGALPEKLDDRDPGLKKILASILTSAPTNAKMKAGMRECEDCGRGILEEAGRSRCLGCERRREGYGS